MRRIVVLLSLTVTALGAAPAPASPVRRGATYDGRGRQPHFSLTPRAGGPDGGFIVRLVVAHSGRRVKVFVWSLPVACHSGYNDAMSYPGTAAILRNGTFRARLPASDSASRLTVTGRFLARGLARGTLDYQGGGPLKGCHANGIWTVRVTPPLPPVQRFVGSTDQGTQVTFQRTIERSPHVTRFTFGSLQTSCGLRRVATGTELGPPFDVQFAIPVHRNSFAGDYFDEAFDIKVTGSFGAGDSASGTVTYGDRGGCNVADVHWTANPATSRSGQPYAGTDPAVPSLRRSGIPVARRQRSQLVRMGSGRLLLLGRINPGSRRRGGDQVLLPTAFHGGG